MPSSAPALSIHLTLDPQTYNFNTPSPPTISPTIESHAPSPLTIFTWKTPLDPHSALYSKSYPITDLATGALVPQTEIRIQRLPFSRARGSYDEKYFLTLHPGVPITLSTGFGRAGGSLPPQRREVVERGWELDAEGKERGVRRSTRPCGVDGLQEGRRYRVNLAREQVEGARWWWGTKDDVMVDKGTLLWNLLPGEKGGLEVGLIEGVEFYVEQ